MLDATAGMVDLKTAISNYIKGVRESGRDNNTGCGLCIYGDEGCRICGCFMASKAIWYLIRSTIRTAAGMNLPPAVPYYGAMGDKPVIAYQYIEGYRPDAYNLTKTLLAK